MKMNKLDIELLFQQGLRNIPPGITMSLITHESKKYIEKSSLTKIQKEYLIGLSKAMNSAYHYSYSFSTLNIYILSDIFSIEHLINLYHQLFLKQKDNFNFRDYLFNPFTITQVDYPYLINCHYRYEQNLHEASVLDLSAFMKDTFNCLNEWDFGEHKKIVIQLIFLQMLILYRTMRKNKILTAFVSFYAMLFSIEKCDYIELLLLFSPLINQPIDEYMLDFDSSPPFFTIDHLKETLLDHTRMGEQYMIQQVQNYLHPIQKNQAPKMNILLAYQQLQDLKNHSSNIQSKQVLESLDLENNECFINILSLITPFHLRSLEDEINLLNNILENIQNPNENGWLDFSKDELKIKVSYFLTITQWINHQPAQTQEALYIEYQKNIKLTHSMQENEHAYQKLQSLVSQPDKVDILNEQQDSTVKSSSIRKILETIPCIKDPLMKNIYSSYVQTHLDVFSSLTDLNDFYIFLQNKLIEQDLHDIRPPNNLNDLTNNLSYLSALTQNSRDIPLLDTIEPKLIFLRKIHQMMHITHQIKEKPIGYFMYFYYLLLYLFGYKTPNQQALIIYERLQDILNLCLSQGLSDDLTMSLSPFETQPIFKNTLN